MRKTIYAHGIIGVSLTWLPFALQISEHAIRYTESA